MRKAEQSLRIKKENIVIRSGKQASVRGLWGALVPAAIICVLVLSGCRAGSVGNPPEGAGAEVSEGRNPGDAGSDFAEGRTPGDAGAASAAGQEARDAGSDLSESRNPGGSGTYPADAAGPETGTGVPGSMDQAEGEKTEKPPAYILTDSDREYLNWEDVKDLTEEQIRLARNEIYARHGRGFQSQDLQAYFDSRPWYKKTVEPEQFSESLLSDVEKWNIRYLKDLEPVDGLPGLSDAPSKHVIDQYGYQDGHSLLSFQLKPGTAKDCGEYYQVDAVFAQGIEAPGNLKYGDRVMLVFNELTGETKTLEYREGGLYPVDEGQYASQYYYSNHEDGSPVTLYQDSDDRVDKPVYDGRLYVRKDATEEIDIVRQVTPVTLSELNGEYNWYNGVFFDRKGYAVRLVMYGD